jgi:hypothetical protein
LSKANLKSGPEAMYKFSSGIGVTLAKFTCAKSGKVISFGVVFLIVLLHRSIT